MIGYVTLGTNDYERAVKFYDELMGSIGAKRYMDFGRMLGWSVSPEQPAFFIAKPFDGKPATVGNGVMIAFFMPSTAAVDAFHKKVLELGGTDDGAPGFRFGSQFYAGYARDLDGNKINAFHVVPGSAPPGTSA